MRPKVASIRWRASRAEFFNIFNHPDFGGPVNYETSAVRFGTQTLNSYLGRGRQSGGLNPLYQIVGPQSIQLALKLVVLAKS